ncbi:MAG: M48 family peptidase, partial [Paludibacteraceae bacterium]|nr:M48 family peptidase [Paludibacteraceae bacterium]
MENLIYFSILAILILEFAFNRTLSFLNIKHSSQPIPEELKDLYDEERYKKQQSYLRTNAKFGLISSTFSFLFVFCMFAFGGYAG